MSEGGAPDSEPAGARPGWLLPLALLLATFLAYRGALDNDFVTYDDGNYVTRNERVLGGLTPANAAWALTTTEYCNWHPLAWLSHQLDVSLFGSEDAAGHHATSVLLHGLGAALLFAALFEMTRARWASALVAALFALHPLRVESVAWVSERKDVLAGVLFLLGLLLHARWVRGGERSGRLRAALHGAYALGLMAKPMGVTFPFVLLVLDRWPLERRTGWGRLVREKAGLFALSLASCAVTYVVQSGGGCTRFIEEGVGFGARIQNALIATMQYVGKGFVPTDLAFFYPHPAVVTPESSRLAAAVAAGLAILAITGLGIALRRRVPALLAGWLLFLGMLVPVIGLVQVGGQALADRYVYLPLVGLQLAVVGLAAAMLRARPTFQPGAAGLALLVLGAFGVLTARQVEVWRDSRRLFEHALDVTDHNYVALINLGRLEAEAGRAAAGAGDMERAVSLLERAHDRFERAVQHAPRFYGGRLNLGWSLNVLSEYEAAAPHLEEAVRLRPETGDAHLKLGLNRMNRGDLEGAETSLREVERLEPLNPDLPAARRLLAEARAEPVQRESP